MIRAVAKEALLFSPVFFYFQRFVLGQPQPHQKSPGKGDGQQGDEFFNAFGLIEVGGFKVEAAGLMAPSLTI